MVMGKGEDPGGLPAASCNGEGEGRVKPQEDSLLPLTGPQLAARHPEPIPWHCGVDGPRERGHLCDLVQGESLELRYRQRIAMLGVWLY